MKLEWLQSPPLAISVGKRRVPENDQMPVLWLCSVSIKDDVGHLLGCNPLTSEDVGKVEIGKSWN